MKRIISFIAVIAMLATMVCVPVSAQTTANSVVLGPVNFNGTAADITAGKAQSVSALKFTKAAGSGDNKVSVSFSETELNSFASYDSADRIHASFWYLTPEKGPDSVAVMMSDYGLDLTDRLSLSSFPVNRWAKIDMFLQPEWTYEYNDGTTDNTVVVHKLIDIRGTKDAVGSGFWQALLGADYDSSKTYTLKNAYTGKFDIYVNGECVLTRSKRKLGPEGYYSSVATNRLAFYVSDSSIAREFYIHNGKIDVVSNFDASTYDFGIASIANGANYALRGDSLYIQGDVKISDIVSESYSASAYSYEDGVYTAVADTDVLKPGNVVVINNASSSILDVNYLNVLGEKIYPYSTGEIAVANSSAVTAGTGIAGKDASDSSGAAAPGKDAFFNTNSGTKNVDGSDNIFVYNFKGYKVISVNLFVSDNSKGGTFRITGQYGALYAGDIAVSNLIPNQWNKVDFVLKMDATYGDGYDGTEPATLTSHLYNGTSSTYVNGNLIKNNQKHAYGGWVKAAGSDPVRDGYTLRVGFNSIPEGVSAYIDDYSSYYTFFTPVLDSAPVLSGDMVSGSFIYANEGETVADVISNTVIADGLNVKAYDVSGMTYTEAEDSADAIGKTVVVCNSANRYSYYSVKSITDAKSYIYVQNFDSDAGLAPGNTTAVYTSSLAGKPADDKSYGFAVGYVAGAGGVVADETSISGFADKNGAPVTQDNILVDENGEKKKTTNSDRFVSIDYVDGMNNFSEISKMKGYKVVSVNVMYTGTATTENLRITSNNSASVSGLIPLNRLQPNQWNRVDFVIEMQGNKTPPAQKVDGEIIEVPNGVCATYVNGRKILERNSCYGSYIWHYSLNNYSSCSGFRLGFGIGSDSDVVGYIDDYVSYFTPFAPDMTEFDAAPYAVKAQIGDEIPQGVSVYTDKTYSGLSTGNVAFGNIIVTETVTDSENNIKRYGYCELRSVDVSETENGIAISSNADSGMLVVAEYSGGELVNTEIYDLAETDSVEYTPDGTNLVKIMVWESNETLCPVDEYVRY